MLIGRGSRGSHCLAPTQPLPSLSSLPSGDYVRIQGPYIHDSPGTALGWQRALRGLQGSLLRLFHAESRQPCAGLCNELRR